jgi:hypothetical protein
MPLSFDTALNVFWLGVATVNLSLLRRRADLFYSFVFWFACFPIPQSIVRAALRPIYMADPTRLWGLTSAAAVPYLLAGCVVGGRVLFHFHRRPSA